MGDETKLAQNVLSQWFRAVDRQQGGISTNHVFDFHIIRRANQSVGGPESFYTYQLGVMDGRLLADGRSAHHRQPVRKPWRTTTTSLTTPATRQDLHLPRSRIVRQARRVCAERCHVNNLQANYFQHLATASTVRSTGVTRNHVWRCGAKCCIVRWTVTGRLVRMPTTL